MVVSLAGAERLAQRPATLAEPPLNEHANKQYVARAVALQSTGKAIVAGDGVFLETTGNYPRFGLMRLDENGDLDPSFGPNGDGRMAFLRLQGDPDIFADSFED